MLLCCLRVLAPQSFLACFQQFADPVELVTQWSIFPNVHPDAWTGTEMTALVWQKRGVYGSGPQPDPDSLVGFQ